MIARNLVGLLSCTILMSSASAEDWPQWQGPNRNAISKERGLLKEWPKDGPALTWKIKGLGGGDGGPAIAAGRIYGMAFRGEDEVVWALSEKDGKQVWATKLGPAFQQRMSQGREGPACTPTVDGERLYVLGVGGELACLQTKDGKIVWQRSMTRDLGGQVPTWSYRESPLIDGDKLICTPGGSNTLIVALEKMTGKTIWTTPAPQGGTTESSAPGSRSGGFGGGGGGFSVAAGVAPQMFVQADANKDQKLSRTEFTGLADTWFDRLDPEKTGKVTAEQFSERFYDAVPRAESPDTSAPAQRRPSRSTAPAFFAPADADKDGSLTRAELKNTFTKWYDQWDADKAEALSEEKFRSGLSAALPRPELGRPGGSGGSGGRGGGFGGFTRSEASYASTIAFDFEGQRQYAQVSAKALVGVAAADGKFLWRYDKPANRNGINCTTPIYHDGHVFASSAYGAGGGVVKLSKNADGGIEADEAWFSNRLQNHHGGVILHNGSLYGANGGNEGGFLVCLDFKTGNVLWNGRDDPERRAPKGSLAMADDRFYYRTERGAVILIEPSPKEYIERGRFEQPERTKLPAWAHPVVANGKLYIRDQDVLFCYDVKAR